MSLPERLWSKIEFGPTVSPTLGRCWVWTGSHTKGYGTIKFGDGPRKVATVVLEWVLGRSLEPGEWCLHHCDTKPCVRPSHLYAGTPKQNADDMVRRGRAVWQIHPEKHPRGEQHGRSKLTWNQVHEIRLSTDNRASLASKYGVSLHTIRAIKQGRLWKEN